MGQVVVFFIWVTNELNGVYCRGEELWVSDGSNQSTYSQQVSATDMDEGANGRVRYGIFSGDENRDFLISEDTGVIRVAKNLNYERRSRYLLTVRAEDCAEDMAEVRTPST
uniref:(California timema) hypothetical protein n=1 Tax=Timema californicum TaxID=61474 RepID=A0A7R9JIV8_TIMCA|nr:unnamed protein product [Timema californicum]